MIQTEEYKQTSYNPYETPAKLEAALLHEKANKFGELDT